FAEHKLAGGIVFEQRDIARAFDVARSGAFGEIGENIDRAVAGGCDRARSSNLSPAANAHVEGAAGEPAGGIDAWRGEGRGGGKCLGDRCAARGALKHTKRAYRIVGARPRIDRIKRRGDAGAAEIEFGDATN